MNTIPAAIFAAKRKPVAITTAFEWAHLVSLRIPCVPVAQPRQRHALRSGAGGRMFVSNYTPTKDPVNVYKATIKHLVRERWPHPPIGCVLQATVVFVFDRPASLLRPRSPSQRVFCDNSRDVDNLLKSTFDALNKLLWLDDRQVVSIVAEKVYRSLDESPHVGVSLYAPSSLMTQQEFAR
jgi:Holliday junction resolvase RusA-like endonuclease